MVDRVVSRFIGTKHERDIKRLTPKIAAINELAGEYEKLTDSEIKEKSASLKFQVTERLAAPIPPNPTISSAWPTHSNRPSLRHSLWPAKPAAALSQCVISTCS